MVKCLNQLVATDYSDFVYSLATALMVGFALPVAITSSLSQIGYLTYAVPWLRQLELLQSWALAAIQGVLPPAVLFLITAMVPSIVRVPEPKPDRFTTANSDGPDQVYKRHYFLTANIDSPDAMYKRGVYTTYEGLVKDDGN